MITSLREWRQLDIDETSLTYEPTERIPLELKVRGQTGLTLITNAAAISPTTSPVYKATFWRENPYEDSKGLEVQIFAEQHKSTGPHGHIPLSLSLSVTFTTTEVTLTPFSILYEKR